MEKLEKIIAAIVAALESVQKIKEDLTKCQEDSAAKDQKIAELETKVEDLTALLAGFLPSQM